MGDTFLDMLRERAEAVCGDSVGLLKDYSSMDPVNPPGSPGLIISVRGDQSWNSLPAEGKRKQVRLLREINRFTELVCVLTIDLPSASRQELGNALKELRSAVEQDGYTWFKTTDEAIKGVRELIRKCLTVLEEFFTASSDVVLAIPDTNALLSNPDIELWRFDDVGRFEIVLTPSVLSELDAHKVNHRNKEVRSKALKLIRKIKEYRRRGSLHNGVPIVTNLVTLRSVAAEPNMSQTLSWLDATNADDRFLATSLEIIRSNAGARLFIVTSDVNMQNKAEFAGIPFCEVPVSRVAEKRA
ncbi:MAG: PIN domain-containing protein [Candidatus Eisenbacteria bacterium]|nr:PIN domain-containing protein [Candidatus Eisenbacteria bacterium]